MADDPKDPSATDDPKEPEKGDPEEKASPDDIKAMKVALKKANKEAEASRLKLKEIEDKDKSESEKLVEKAATAEKRAQDAELRVMRVEVAVAKGLSPAQAKRLDGSTKEDLEADADDFLESIKPPDDKGTPPGKPRERLAGGGDPTETPEETDPAKLAAKVNSGLVV